MKLVRGYWETKDTSDKLDVEIEKKRKARYPQSRRQPQSPNRCL